MQVKRLGLSEWRDVLPPDGTEVFHSPEALRIVDRYTSSELRLLGGFRGQGPAGLLPVHETTRLGGRVLASPPLG